MQLDHILFLREELAVDRVSNEDYAWITAWKFPGTAGLSRVRRDPFVNLNCTRVSASLLLRARTTQLTRANKAMGGAGYGGFTSGPPGNWRMGGRFRAEAPGRSA